MLKQVLSLLRHTDEMITKLETAGLGYYVKSDSTQHKFGKNTYVAILNIMIQCNSAATSAGQYIKILIISRY